MANSIDDIIKALLMKDAKTAPAASPAGLSDGPATSLPDPTQNSPVTATAPPDATVTDALKDIGREYTTGNKVSLEPRGVGVSEYNPSVRDMLGALVAGDSSPGSVRNRLAHELVGSAGVGGPNLSAVDLTPAGPGLYAQEEAQKGNWLPAAAVAGGGVAGRAVEPMVKALSKFPRLAAGTAGATGLLTSTSEAGDITPSAVTGKGPMESGYPEQPRRADFGPTVMPEMPKDIEKRGSERRQNWLNEQKQRIAAGDASYADAMAQWNQSIKDIDSRVASKTTEMANRPMREQFPAAFYGLTYGPAVLSGLGAFRAQRAIRNRLADELSAYKNIERAAEDRVLSGKKPLKSMTEALANKPEMEAGKPWKTIGEGALGGAGGPLLPSMFDYQAAPEGSRAKTEADKNLFSEELMKQLLIGALKGGTAGYMGAATANALPLLRR